MPKSKSDYAEGYKYGSEHPIDSTSHIVHKSIGTAPKRSEKYEEGVKDGKKDSQK